MTSDRLGSDSSMIIVTGGAGFIGSAMVHKLNKEGHYDILIVDNLNTSEKWKNLVQLKYTEYIPKFEFYDILLNSENSFDVDYVIHMGACSSTTQNDMDYLFKNNVEFSKNLVEWCIQNHIPFIYASSAATYGEGEHGFDDDHALVPKLRPVNRYGYSKQLFDLWVLENHLEDSITGLKFFNVFGPNEYHKGDMASVISKAYHTIKADGYFSLFKSHREDYGDGEQKRDFVYIKDITDAMWFLMQEPQKTGIYNLGTGKARSWNDLIHAVFKAMDLKPDIRYIDMPENLRGAYQYFTEAKMEKLKNAGYKSKFHSLEEAVKDYVQNYLMKDNPYLSSL